MVRTLRAIIGALAAAGIPASTEKPPELDAYGTRAVVELMGGTSTEFARYPEVMVRCYAPSDLGAAALADRVTDVLLDLPWGDPLITSVEADSTERDPDAASPCYSTLFLIVTNR